MPWTPSDVTTRYSVRFAPTSITSEPASFAMHAKFVITEMGRLKSLGRKHVRWLDALQMPRALGQGDTAPPEEEPR